MIEINLLPGGGRKPGFKGAATMDVSDVLANIASRFRDVYLGVAIIAVAGSVAGGVLMYQSQTMRRAELAERERQGVLDSTRFATIIKARKSAEAERDSVSRQVSIIRLIDDNRFTWSHMLEEVSRALPAYTWLTEISQISTAPNPAAMDVEPGLKSEAPDTSKAARARAKQRSDSILLAAQAGVRFKLVGQTVDVQALTHFMRALERSPFVQNVHLTRSDLVLVDGKEITEFQLEADSERAGPAFIRSVPISVEIR
jgi:Tfp pilus assembly protein PilN